MKHNLKISVSKRPPTDGIIACRKFKFREKLLNRLFGPLRSVMVLVPGGTVETVSITEVPEGGGGSE